MLRNFFITFVMLTFYTLNVNAQAGEGSIKGTVTDNETKEGVPFSNVTLYKGENQIMISATDFDGNYTLKPIVPGTYTVKVSFIGYRTKELTQVVVNSDKITFLDCELAKSLVAIDTVEISVFKDRLVKRDGDIGKVTKREELINMPVQNIAEVARITGSGVSGRDDGTGVTVVKGDRPGGSIIIVDGVKILGSNNIPIDAIEEIAVKTGGLSAQYGDVTGSVTTVTTRGGFKNYFGSVGLLSSGFKTGKTTSFGTDKFGYNLFEFATGGPILAKRDSSGKVISSRLGFLLTGEFQSNLDSRPSVKQLYKPKDEVEELIRTNPYVFDAESNSVLKRAELLTADDFEEIDFRLNDNDRSFTLNGKVDIKLSDLSSAAIGGTFNYFHGNNYNRNFSLFNYQNNSESFNSDYRIWGRYTQRFANAELKEGEEDKQLLKNAFFSIQADFSRNSSLTQDRNHENDFFKYGYLGKFTANTEFSYSDNNGEPITLDGQEYRGRFLSAFDSPISYDYTPSNINSTLSNYTSSYYTFFPQGDPRYSTREQVEGNGGIVNGGSVTGAVYNMWSAPGTVSNGFAKGENDQIRLSGRGSADIGDHAIMIGFEYEQRIQRSYSLAPRGLWDLGRLSVNSHILQLDSANFNVQYAGPNPIDPTVTFERRYGGDDQRSYFAYNMRRALGLDPGGTDFIDFDSYDVDLYNMNFFSADQLISPANNVNLTYRGYDYKGKKLNSSPSLQDFFNETNELGFKTRPIPAYQPVYIAGYIEDKFAFDDLIFRVGLRLDRFDANQPVLKDQFSFFPTRDVAYARTQGLSEVPGNIKDNYVVYVKDIDNPTARDVVGYRDPNTDVFYNTVGDILNDPSVLQSGSSIAPWLQEPEKRSTTQDMNTSSFKDYEPQYTLMPRISFSFPISDEANFFANYDILTRRPSGENVLEPIDIMYVTSHDRIINNPNLKPSKTITYEIGFKQELSINSALTLSSFYREQRDEIQVRKLVGAYPEDYLTYDNIDFGTVKGFILEYEMRRTKNVSFRFNYTLQFAEGTGSGSLSSISLVNSDQPNLRTIFPYQYDVRHQIVSTIDYRYGAGRNYKGPTLAGKNLLENMGLYLVMTGASGTPYTTRSLPGSSELFSGATTNQPVEGDINGARLPWTFQIDARLDKTFNIKWGKSSEENTELWKEGKKRSTLNVYVQIRNLMNRQNIRNVYSFTGNPDDDGYLASPLFQDQIRSQTSEQSYRDLYSFRLQNPNNYELPRRIRVGAQLSF